MFRKFLFVFLATLLLTTHLFAQIATDGTLGEKTTLPGPNFQIDNKLGQQMGSNLFHSFETFNLHSGESATFANPESATNIIARVTGGNRSLIDGQLSATANLYLLNPSGILFGNHASLDISGSFHASTADYLRLGDDGYFYANPTNPSLLKVASPTAFGFLDNNHLESRIETTDGTRLTVPEGQILSLIGNHLQIQDSILWAYGGRINLAAVASAGEVIPTESGLDVNSFGKLGTINLSQSSTLKLYQEGGGLGNVDVSGYPAGQIFIRAGQFVASKGQLFADTYGGKGGKVDIAVTGEMRLEKGAKITASNHCDNDNNCGSRGGDIYVKANSLLLKGLDDENIEETDEINKLSGILTNNSTPNGTGGNIEIRTSSLESSPGLIQALTDNQGDAGNIVIENAQQIILNDHGFINTATGGPGRAGNITLRHINILSLANYSSISASAESTGDAGEVLLEDIHHLTLNNWGQILSFNTGGGNAGPIKITADDISLFQNSGIITLATEGKGNKIDITASQRLYLVESALLTRTFSSNPQAGAGEANLKVGTYSILNNSQILATAKAGPGGNISLTASQYLPSSDSIIDASSEFNIDGQVLINAPEVNLNGIFAGLPRTFSTLGLSLSRCASFSKDYRSRFLITARDVLPQSPEDLRTHLIQLK